jgi:hypothetical protein
MANNATIDRVYVDFGRTFGRAVFLGVEPKMGRVDKEDRNSKQVHQRDEKTSQYKWTVALAVKVQSFEQKKNVTLNVTVLAASQPCGNIELGELVEVRGLQMGIMKDGGVYWSADEVVPADASVPSRPSVTASANQ